MSFAASHSAQMYAKVGLETNVASASPHQLILMLFDGALLAIAKANTSMLNKQIAEKGQAISHAIDIISNGLGASLNLSAGDELANRLASLYDYMCTRLLYANLNNDPAALTEVSGLLGEIKMAWEAIASDPDVLAYQAKKAAA